MPGRRASLSDISNVDDIESLSVRQLKEILARNFVNYKGCCEKWELMERVTRLYHDQKNLQQKGTTSLKETLYLSCVFNPFPPEPILAFLTEPYFSNLTCITL